MNECRYIVSWCCSGGLIGSKIYKYRKSAFTFAYKLKDMFYKESEVMVERQERKGETWATTAGWRYD